DARHSRHDRPRRGRPVGGGRGDRQHQALSGRGWSRRPDRNPRPRRHLARRADARRNRLRNPRRRRPAPDRAGAADLAATGGAGSDDRAEDPPGPERGAQYRGAAPLASTRRARAAAATTTATAVAPATLADGAAAD